MMLSVFFEYEFLGGGFEYVLIFFLFTPTEEMIQFDEHIFQMGSINYLQSIWLNVWSISRSAGGLEWEEIREESESTRKESKGRT